MKQLLCSLFALLMLSSALGSSSSSDCCNSDDALSYGINWIFNKAAQKYDISTSNIQVTKINNAQTTEKKSSTYYSFDVESTNNADATINVTFTIGCDSKTFENRVTVWNYHINYDIKPQEDCNVTTQNTSTPSDEELQHDVEVTQPEQPTEPDCEQPENGQPTETEVEVDVEVDVPAPTEDEEENNTDCENTANPDTEHDVEVEIPQPNNSENEECPEPQNKCDSNTALNYGINWIFQKAAQKYDISTSNIQITKTNSATTTQQNSKTYFNFDVESTNNKDATINATFTVKCNSNTGEKSVGKWSSHINYHINDDCDDTPQQPEQPEETSVEVEVEHDVEVELQVPTQEESNECDTTPHEEEGTTVEVQVEVDVETEGQVPTEEEEENNTECENPTNPDTEHDVEIEVQVSTEEESEECDTATPEEEGTTVQVEVEVDIETEAQVPTDHQDGSNNECETAEQDVPEPVPQPTEDKECDQPEKKSSKKRLRTN